MDQVLQSGQNVGQIAGNFSFGLVWDLIDNEGPIGVSLSVKFIFSRGREGFYLGLVGASF